MCNISLLAAGWSGSVRARQLTFPSVHQPVEAPAPPPRHRD